MANLLTDAEIATLLAEQKNLPADWRKRLALKQKHGHSESELDITGSKGSEFRLMRRRSDLNPLDFSVILAYRAPGSNQLFRLKRYNGRSHEHSNRLERGAPFYDFHIHTATERYQQSGRREDSFAEPTNRYADIEGATKCLFDDCAFQIPGDEQGELFA